MAARFWVGGTGTWNATNTTNWAGTSGGAGGQSVPTSADTVTFDGNSGTSFTVTIESGYNPSVISVTGGTATVTLNINSQTLTVQTFNFSNAISVTRTLAFGTTGQITVTGNGATVFTVQLDTGVTTSGSRNVVFTYSGGTGTRTIGCQTFSALNTNSLNYFFQGGTDTISMGGQSGIIVRNLDMTGFSGTFTSNVIRAAGNVTFSPTMTMTAVASTINFSGSAGATQTFTSAGLTLPLGITVSTTGGGTVVFADDVTCVATQTLNLTSGTLNLNNRTVNVGLFSTGGSVARTLAFGTSSVFNLTGTNGGVAVWNVLAATNWTVTGTAVVNCTYSGAPAARSINAGSVTEANAISFNITAGTDTVTLGGTVRDLNFTGFTGIMGAAGRSIFGNLTLVSGMTVAAGASATTFAATTSGTRTITTAGLVFPQSIRFTNVGGTGGTWQLQDNFNQDNGSLLSTMFLDSGNVDLNNNTLTVGLVSTNNTSTRRIVFGATGNLNVYGNSTTLWSASTATNFSYTGNGRVNFTYAGATGNRTISHGSTAGGSPSTAAPPMYFNAGTDNVVTTSGGQFSDLDFAGFTGSVTNTARSLTGNLILGTGMTVTGGSSTLTFNGVSANQTLVTNGVTTDFPITIFSTNGNFVLGETLNLVARTLTVNQGNLIANGYDITVSEFVSSNGNPRIIDISNVTVTLNGTLAVWNMTTTTGANLIATNSNINLTDATTSTRTFSGGGLTYGNLDIGGATGTSNLLITGNNTFLGAITSSKTVAHGILFVAGQTTTVDGFTVSGSSGNVVTITSSTAATHNLVFTGAGNVDVSYADISYSNASPTNTWYALLTNNNTNSGNNTGWIFTTGSPASSNFFLVF